MNLKLQQKFRYLTLILAVSIISACACQQPRQPKTISGGDPVTFEQAVAAYDRAGDLESLLQAIGLLESYAESHSSDYYSRARLANAYTLLGAGYTQSGRGKAKAYEKAMSYADAAFNTDGTYQLARLNGKTFAQALEYLDARHMEALEFWKTAMFYSFREASGPVAKLWRYPRLKEAVAVMQRQEAIDRQAMWGNNLMSWGIYYLAQPEFYGGDRDKARSYLAEAAAVSQSNIVPRWGRAKYFAVAMGDVQTYRSDLQWVAAQPLDKLDGYRPWNLLLQREARALLQQESEFF